MSFPVRHHEPARGINIYAARFERVATLAEVQSALSARAEALFASDLSARREYTEIEVTAAVTLSPSPTAAPTHPASPPGTTAVPAPPRYSSTPAARSSWPALVSR
jgi:hypothetical protein